MGHTSGVGIILVRAQMHTLSSSSSLTLQCLTSISQILRRSRLTKRSESKNEMNHKQTHTQIEMSEAFNYLLHSLRLFVGNFLASSQYLRNSFLSRRLSVPHTCRSASDASAFWTAASNWFRYVSGRNEGSKPMSECVPLGRPCHDSAPLGQAGSVPSSSATAKSHNCR